MFCAALQLAMAVWIDRFGFRDRPPNVLDLRLANDILLLCESEHVAIWLLDNLVRCCSHVGVLLNMDKTGILRTEAQPPSQLSTPNGLVVDILSGLTSHKWLGCQLSSKGSANTQKDVEFRLKAASRPLIKKNRQALCDRRVSILEPLKYFRGKSFHPFHALQRAIRNPHFRFTPNGCGVSEVCPTNCGSSI